MAEALAMAAGTEILAPALGHPPGGKVIQYFGTNGYGAVARRSIVLQNFFLFSSVLSHEKADPHS